MSEFNVINITPLLDKLNIESSHTNCYLFLMFFLQRCQLVANLIRLINQESTLSIGIKYCIMNEERFGDIAKKMREFRKEFDKGDLINEILNFIKSTMDGTVKKSEELSLVKKKEDEYVKPLYFRTKMQLIISDFKTLKDMVKSIDDSISITEDDISNYLNDEKRINYVREDGRRVMERELTKLELNWIKYKKGKIQKNKELYNLLKNWYDL